MAQTPEDFDLLRKTILNIQSRQRAMKRLGVGVSIEGYIEGLASTSMSSRQKLLNALLTSKDDDESLRNIIASTWWENANNILVDHMQILIHKNKDLSQFLDLPARIVESMRNNIKDFLPEYSEMINMIYLKAPEQVLRLIYQLDFVARKALLRKLLSGQKGILSSQQGRDNLLDQFFELHINNEGEKDLRALLKKIFQSTLLEIPEDDLYLFLDPLLTERVANRPKEQGSWDKQAYLFTDEAFVRAVSFDPSNDDDFDEDRKNLLAGISDQIRSAYRGDEKKDTHDTKYDSDIQQGNPYGMSYEGDSDIMESYNDEGIGFNDDYGDTGGYGDEMGLDSYDQASEEYGDEQIPEWDDPDGSDWMKSDEDYSGSDSSEDSAWIIKRIKREFNIDRFNDPGNVIFVYLHDMMRRIMTEEDSFFENSSVEGDLLSFVPEDYLNRDVDLMSPIDLIISSAQQLGAPGVRFLQLLGYTMDIPQRYQLRFMDIYDALQGQSTAAAWETTKQQMPEYTKRVIRIKGRLGGGSLYSVFEVEIRANETDYPEFSGQIITEAVRVMNPNALYHARKNIQLIRQVINALAKKDEKYRQALPTVTLLEEWIETELQDMTFEKDDRAFRKKWEGQKFAASKNSRITIPSMPKSGPGTILVRRERIVDGFNFTELHRLAPNAQKEAVALAAQHYLAQLAGGQSLKDKIVAGVTTVHSDISPGNLRITKSGNLAILDRGMYLKFNRRDRLFLNSAIKASDHKELVSLIVNQFWGINENKIFTKGKNKKVFLNDLTQSLLKDSSKSFSFERVLLRMMVEISARGMKIPLRYMLLFKNLNVLNQMSQQVGFASLKEALSYSSSDDSLGGIDMRKSALNLKMQGASVLFDAPLDNAMVSEIMNADGLMPIVTTITTIQSLFLEMGLTPK